MHNERFDSIRSSLSWALAALLDSTLDHSPTKWYTTRAAIRTLHYSYMESTCSHLDALSLKAPTTRSTECSQCFNNENNDDGIDICLSCYNAGCPRLHAQSHADKFGDHHAVVVNIHRVRKSVDNDQQPTSAKRVCPY
jgi:hypothetical protein